MVRITRNAFKSMKQKLDIFRGVPPKPPKFKSLNTEQQIINDAGLNQQLRTRKKE